jgi:hypothetical protein
MTARIGRQSTVLKREALARRRLGFEPLAGEQAPEAALVYSNGYVTVRISQAALDAYIDENGDVPLPLVIDPETGDRRLYDARNAVRVVQDAGARLREVAKRSSDGLFVRINFTDDEGPQDVSKPESYGDLGPQGA